jgi:hypothetical protein
VFVDAGLRTLIERAPVLVSFGLDVPRLRLARTARHRAGTASTMGSSI